MSERYPDKGRALGQLSFLPLTLFFYIVSSAPLLAADESFDTSISSYVAKMALSILLLMLLGFLAVRFLPGRIKGGAQGRLKLLGALSLGRDAVYLVQVGPDVVAMLVSRTGPLVLGRWSLDEWAEDHEEIAVTPR